MKIIKYSRKPLGRKRLYYWKALAVNGRTIAIGGEGYNNKADRDIEIFRLRHKIQDAEIIDND